MTESINQDVGPKVAATPTAYNPTGSTQAPGGTKAPSGYPSNPAEPPAVNSGPAAGQPSQAESFSMGITFLSPCSVCGIAIQPDQLSGHIVTHSTGFMQQGSHFGNRNFSVDADSQTGRYSVAPDGN